MLPIVETISELRKIRALWHDQSIAFVPTMGNLHAGHLSLIQYARTLASRVVVSIFVNPLQFGPTEDYATYPRTLDLDTQKLTQAGVDLLFAPSAQVIYPRGQVGMTMVTVPGLHDILCGVARPSHFTGVATVVTLLFHIVQPQAALFGEKDYQQLLIIRKLVSDLCLPIQVVSYPTVRENDGLAMSSRNGYLSPEEREQAPLLYRTLLQVRASLMTGVTDYQRLEENGHQTLQAAGFVPEYCTIRRAEDLTLPQVGDRQLIVLAAARMGRTRLIDNVQVTL